MSRYSLIPFMLLFGFFSPLSILLPHPFSKLVLGLGGTAFVFGSIWLFTKRKCGHGYISQGRGGWFYPFVVRECPKCGQMTEG